LVVDDDDDVVVVVPGVRWYTYTGDSTRSRRSQISFSHAGGTQRLFTKFQASPCRVWRSLGWRDVVGLVHLRRQYVS
jgi:hypothetical protein